MENLCYLRFYCSSSHCEGNYSHLGCIWILDLLREKTEKIWMCLDNFSPSFSYDSKSPTANSRSKHKLNHQITRRNSKAHYCRCFSMHAVLPEYANWQDFLGQAYGSQPLSFTRIHCHDLCKLIYFGSSGVKLVASHCLLELFTRISSQKTEKTERSEILNCTTRYLLSVISILEGLVFCSDIRVAVNCGLCLSMILDWEILDTELGANRRNNWCRLIVEELAMSLAVPRLASESFMIHHKPAVHVAVTLLKLRKVPEWMSSVFDDCCISGIVENLSASNLSSEMVLLFRELVNARYLKSEQIASLNRIFQVRFGGSISCLLLPFIFFFKVCHNVSSGNLTHRYKVSEMYFCTLLNW